MVVEKQRCYIGIDPSGDGNGNTGFAEIICHGGTYKLKRLHTFKNKVYVKERTKHSKGAQHMQMISHKACEITSGIEFWQECTIGIEDYTNYGGAMSSALGTPKLIGALYVKFKRLPEVVDIHLASASLAKNKIKDELMLNLEGVTASKASLKFEGRTITKHEKDAIRHAMITIEKVEGKRGRPWEPKT